jgi:hypothetical protein
MMTPKESYMKLHSAAYYVLAAPVFRDGSPEQEAFFMLSGAARCYLPLMNLDWPGYEEMDALRDKWRYIRSIEGGN